jgi:hypothetical protein
MSEGRIDVVATPDGTNRIYINIEALDPTLPVTAANGVLTAELTVAEAQYLSDELAGAIEAEARPYWTPSAAPPFWKVDGRLSTLTLTPRK